uniref:Uncharacterized protein n=1 Tax=Arundo donax TaxID=35708 RepID=A0A0A9PSV7_ARUDO
MHFKSSLHLFSIPLNKQRSTYTFKIHRRKFCLFLSGRCSNSRSHAHYLCQSMRPHWSYHKVENT